MPRGQTKTIQFGTRYRWPISDRRFPIAAGKRYRGAGMTVMAVFKPTRVEAAMATEL